MTNRLAIWLAGIIALMLLADGFVQHFAATLFVARKLADMIEWLAFWR